MSFTSASKPLNSVALDSFKAQANRNGALHVFPVLACRDATVLIQPNAVQSVDNVQPVSFSVRVGTPDFLYAVPLPEKGAINIDPVCNASSSDSPTDPNSEELDAINAALSQAKAIESSVTSKSNAKGK